MKQHVILVGLPGAGKTTVGRRAAELLATDFIDIDETVEAETGRSIAAIFRDPGEAEFRRLERSAMQRALAAPARLIAAGGGWIMQPGNLEDAHRSGASVLYLNISPGVGARRLQGNQSRPLLAGGDPGVRLRTLLDEREAMYRNADLEVDGEGDVETVAAKVARAISRDAAPA